MNNQIIEAIIEESYISIEKYLHEVGLSTEGAPMDIVAVCNSFSFYLKRRSFREGATYLDSIPYLSIFGDYTKVEIHDERIILDFRIRKSIFPSLDNEYGYDHESVINSFDSVIKLIDYGLNVLRNNIFRDIKENIFQIDDFTPILQKLTVEMVKPSTNMADETININFYEGRELSIVLEFDVVNEEDYLIGGKIYEEGRKRFEKQK